MKSNKTGYGENAEEICKKTKLKKGGAHDVISSSKVVSILPETGFIRLPKVLSLIPISKSSLYAGIQKNKYPAPIKLSERCSAWRVEDIRQLIEDLAA